LHYKTINTLLSKPKNKLLAFRLYKNIRRITMPRSSEVTWVDDGICVCNNCGAHAASPQKIEHFATCRRGEAARWEKFYLDTGKAEEAWREKPHDEAAYLEAEKTEEAWWEEHYNTILD
jgi:hypothetical protein